MTKVLGVFNFVGETCIGLEIFSRITDDVDKHLLSIGESREVTEAFLADTYPSSGWDIEQRGTWLGSSLLGALLAILRPHADVVMPHHTAATVLVTAARLKGHFRMIVPIHANFEGYTWYQRLVFLVACLVADRVVCNSEGTLRTLPRLINKTKACVIYNGIDFVKLDNFIVNETNISGVSKGSSLVIGTVCRFVPQKDLGSLVRAFGRLIAKLPDRGLVLQLVGDGPVRKDLESLVGELGIWESVVFEGEVSRNEVYRHLAGMDIFGVSSRSEGFCNAMIEAAAAGKPIVATNIDPLPEVVGRDNAVFFEVGDSAALADELYTLVTEPERRMELGDKARRFARGRYALETCAAQYEALYEEVVAAD